METKDLVLTTEDISKDIIKADGRFNAIITKAGDPAAMALKTITEEKLFEIAEFMPEVNRAVAAFSKQNSQTTASLMTLGMLEAGPYRVLRQILAQIEKKRGALKENIFNLEEKKLEWAELNESLNNLTTDDSRFAEQVIQLKMDKIASDTIDATTHIEAALKELGAYKERYEEVRKNNDIPEQWDEEDFEDAEVEHHIKAMFRNAIRDRMQGSHNMGTMEYMEQFGINPLVAYAMVDQYIQSTRDFMHKNNMAPDINAHYEFFDKMYETFGSEYKKAMRRLGLDNISHADWLMKENA